MERKFYIDLLKVFMSFFIVALHFSFLKDINIAISNYLNQGVFRLAVPLFLVINGYYFTNIQSRSQYLVWLKRVGWLYLFWTVVYSYYIFKLDFNHIVLSIFNGYFHLWYIVAMIGASFILFLFRKKTNRFLAAVMLSLYILGCMLQYLNSYEIISLFTEYKNSSTNGLPSFFYRNFLFFGLPFFIAGFLYGKNEIKVNTFVKSKSTSLLVICCVVLIFVEISINQKYALKKTFELLFFLLPLAPLLFVRINQIVRNYDTKYLGLLSSSVYFIHPLIYSLIVSHFRVSETLTVFMVFIFSLLISVPIILINKKIRII